MSGLVRKVSWLIFFGVTIALPVIVGGSWHAASLSARPFPGDRDAGFNQEREKSVVAFRLTALAFVAGGDIPFRYTCDGDDIAPQLTWSGAPAGTQSFALVATDPDAPNRTFTHWVLFDIPASRSELPQGVQTGAIGVSGRNNGGGLGYMGPCPPSGTHRYFFRLSALDVPTLGLKPGASREQVEEVIAAHTLGTAELMGRYGR